jgi:hypothetical protein
MNRRMSQALAMRSTNTFCRVTQVRPGVTRSRGPGSSGPGADSAVRRNSSASSALVRPATNDASHTIAAAPSAAISRRSQVKS